MQAGGATGQQQSNLHRLAQSTQVLKTAVASLTQYQVQWSYHVGTVVIEWRRDGEGVGMAKQNTGF